MTISSLASRLKKTESEVAETISELKGHLEQEHSIAVLSKEDAVSLVTAQKVSDIVEKFAKEEFSGDLSRAALETLTIIAYRGPLRKHEIDYIRGVNSSFIIRNLLVRGLINRVHDKNDSRYYQYSMSSEFLRVLGITSLNELPDYPDVEQKLNEFLKESLEPKNDVE